MFALKNCNTSPLYFKSIKSFEIFLQVYKDDVSISESDLNALKRVLKNESYDFITINQKYITYVNNERVIYFKDICYQIEIIKPI